MGIEIERKFLVVGEGWRTAVGRSERMVQGYLGGDRCSMRVRVAGAQAWLNIKSKTLGAERLEYEFPLPLPEAQELLAHFCATRVEKTRHYVSDGARRWEIDEFAGRNAGLVIAEIELAHAEEAFERPAWLGREVTDDPRYYNTALASAPWREWGLDASAGG